MHKVIVVLCIGSLFFSCGIKKSILDRPNLTEFSIDNSERLVLNDSLYFKGNNSLRKNKYGQWELVASGKNPLDLGNTIGSLTRELVVLQENVFLEKIDQLVPSDFKQKLLKKFLSIYNRKIHLYVGEEYKAEIYGVSQYASDAYNHFADKYLLSLYLHSAHDIGHALQDLALVGCSSFAVWDEKTVDGNLLLGRNFDFYAGDDFSKEKVISFINPEKGHKFMSVSWAGMIGVMSGMNDEGLTVTINAGKSDIPFLAKTPISLVTREILQYAKNIDEAIAIAKKKDVFVSESIMVGSAKDNKAILIEMSPNNFGVYDVGNSSQLICSNHFQSDAYEKDKKNKEHIIESHSKYRFDRMSELLEGDKITPKKAVDILRNTKGLDDKEIGYGNEKALNQLLAHHGIVFQPHKKMVWVSSNPYQLGEFVAYQLDSVFKKINSKKSSLSLGDVTIKKDPFLKTKAYRDYEQFRVEKRLINEELNLEKEITEDRLNFFIALNPNSWEVYYFVGKYYYQKKKYKESLVAFNMALNKEVTTVPDKEAIKKYIKKIKRKL